MTLNIILKAAAAILATIAFLLPEAFGTSPELKWILICFLYILTIDLDLHGVLVATDKNNKNGDKIGNNNT
jgi:hypothetical protein